MDTIERNGAPLENIVISGMSGRFPNSRTLNDLAENLYNKIDMVDEIQDRWTYTHDEVPKRMGNVANIGKFDATFFGVHFKQTHALDPQGRCLIEHAYEALLDAGVNPVSVRGKKIGVYIGSSFPEADKVWFYDKMPKDGFGITGSSRAMLANRISYSLGFTGPSYFIDTGCSSSIVALDNAFNAMQNGDCEAALVGGSNILLHPFLTLQYNRMGVIAPDGYSRPFDDKASGYNRSESIGIVFLQKAADAKRIYAQVLYTKFNSEGYREKGIIHPSGVEQMNLLEKFYREINFDPSVVNYVEANCSGSILADPEECYAIDMVFNKNRKKPLAVGSIKSNVGHAEPASGMCALAKAILCFENGTIPANINYSTPRKSIPALLDGRLQVVTDSQALEGPYISINSFGLGGINSHCLLKGNDKAKVNKGEPTDSLCRLVTWSGRTEEAVNHVLDYMTQRPIDVELLSLIYNTQRESTTGNVFRGYGLYSHQPAENAVCVTKDVKHATGMKRPMVWVFTGMGSQWATMGTALLKIPLFRESVEKSHAVLAKKGLNLMEIITADDPKLFDNILNSFVGIAAIQIAIVDILKALKLEPDYLIGHSVGELGCAYADGCFTAEQMILSSYSRGMASIETNVVPGLMAAVGLGYKKMRTMLPSGIEIACHNGPDSCTLSGPTENIIAYVKQLKSQGIFAKEVNCSNIPYHSSFISEMGPRLLKRLQEVIPDPKKRSPKWLSSSVLKSQWDLPENQYSSPQYHTNNLLGSVLFEETSAYLPKDAIAIEIAPHSLLQAILKKSLPDAVNIGLTQRGNKLNDQFFMSALGKIYAEGFDMDLEVLYPPVEFPVSRGTPMISPLIKWDHSQDWYVPNYEIQQNSECGERKIKISLDSPEYEFLIGHNVDDQVQFPASAYLYLAWETLAIMNGTFITESNVQFEDVRFLRKTVLTKGSEYEFKIMIQPGTGRFEISEGAAAVATGFITTLEDTNLIDLSGNQKSDVPVLKTEDFYKELSLRGYHFTGLFKSVLEAGCDGLRGRVKWESNWTAFLDCLFQIKVLGKDTRSLCLPSEIQKLKINVSEHMSALASEQSLEVLVSNSLKTIRCGGIEIIDLELSVAGRQQPEVDPVLENYTFVPNISKTKYSVSDGLRICVQIALENVRDYKIKAVEVDTQHKNSIIPFMQEALDDYPLVIADLMVLTNQTLSLPGIHVEDGKLSTQTNCLFVIGSGILSDQKFLVDTTRSLSEVGYVISRESELITQEIKLPVDYAIIACLNIENEVLVLLQHRKPSKFAKDVVIQVSESDKEFKWLQALKPEATNNRIILFAQNEELSGILGLVNCVRKETTGKSVVCFFIDDKSAPKFDIQSSFYKGQLKLGLGINVYRNGKWGTYRHLQVPLSIESKPTNEHCYLKQSIKSDVNSLEWVKGPYSHYKPKKELVKVHYSSLNYRDMMLATGKVDEDAITASRLEQESLLGFEYSGVTQNGKRVMGLTAKSGMSTHVEADDAFTFNIPESWTLAEAATVPVAYAIVYNALFTCAQIQKGKSILVHDGCSDIGIAAIRTCFAYDLKVFTTVRTKEEKNFLIKEFPQLQPEDIGDFNSSSYEKNVFCRTNDVGVNYIMNSMAEEKFLKSIRCLSPNGIFLEIENIDTTKDSEIGLYEFLRGLSFYSVMLDKILKAPHKEKLKLFNLIEKDLKTGVIKPLKTNIFPASKAQQAFRCLESGQHIGKVVLQLRTDEKSDCTLPIPVMPRMYCSPEMSYVILGGLGEFGMELADWLVVRGCRKLVVGARGGLSKPYQAYRIKLWESYGVKVLVNSSDISTKTGCEQLIKEAASMGPVGGVFNLAAVMEDGELKNQNSAKFANSLAPKAEATKYLDQVTSKLCPQLQYFVVFSSASCGRGNAGQSNYGMGNSVMERIVERRSSDGLPAKAIQWGPVGELGIKLDSKSFEGLLPQRFASCLEKLDTIMSGSAPITSSVVVAKKEASSFKKLQEYSAEDETVKLKLANEDTPTGLKMILRDFGDEENIGGPILRLESLNNSDSFKTCVLIVPGIEGIASNAWYSLAENIEMPTFVLQTNVASKASSVKEIVDEVFEDVKDLFSNLKHYYLVGYSFGGSIALELAERLEKCNKMGQLILMDTSPAFLKKMSVEQISQNVDKRLEDTYISAVMDYLFPNKTEEFTKKIAILPTVDQKIKILVDLASESSGYSPEHLRSVLTLIYKRIQIMYQSDLSKVPKLASPIALIRPTQVSYCNIDETYEMSDKTESEFVLKFVDGTHTTMLENEKLATWINDFSPTLRENRLFQKKILNSEDKLVIE